jgi:hypothetical protein
MDGSNSFFYKINKLMSIIVSLGQKGRASIQSDHVKNHKIQISDNGCLL